MHVSKQTLPISNYLIIIRISMYKDHNMSNIVLIVPGGVNTVAVLC